MTQGRCEREERRRYERLARDFTIHYRPLEDMAGAEADRRARMCDFSGGGVRFLADRPLAKRQQLLVRIEFSGWRDEGGEWVRTGDANDVGVLKAIGSVMWCAPSDELAGHYEVGLMFTGRMR